MSEDDSTSSYGSMTITREFDEVGPGMFVTIKNPAMLPPSKLSAQQDLSKIKDRKHVARVVDGWIASFVIDWKMLDVSKDDWDDNPQFLGDPSAETLGCAPGIVQAWILKLIKEAQDPL